MILKRERSPCPLAVALLAPWGARFTLWFRRQWPTAQTFGALPPLARSGIPLHRHGRHGTGVADETGPLCIERCEVCLQIVCVCKVAVDRGVGVG